jgi:hypothetical protein
VADAQFYRGALPGDESGPPVEAVNLVVNSIHAGYVDKSFSAVIGPQGTASALMLGGDPGYWVVVAGPPAADTPTLPSVTATLQFSDNLLPGTYDLNVSAIDGSGKFGKPNVTKLTAAEQGLPQGTLVVSLAWDTESDLDLHVIDGNGAEIFYGNINSWQPPGPGQPPPPPDAYKSGGILDFDSNAHCVIDGLRREHVVWTQTPPKGHYIARVDAFSLCGQPFAHWSVVEYLDGKALTQARGVALADDTRGDHGRDSGLTAIEFDVP